MKQLDQLIVKGKPNVINKDLTPRLDLRFELNVETMLDAGIVSNMLCLLKKDEKDKEEGFVQNHFVIGRAWPSFKLERKEIQLTSHLIRNLDVSLGEHLSLVPLELKSRENYGNIGYEILEIREIIISPIELESGPSLTKEELDAHLPYFIKLLAMIEYVCSGNIITLNLAGKPLQFKIDQCVEHKHNQPALIYKIMPNTTITFNQPSKSIQNISDSAKQQIGGLQPQIEQLMQIMKSLFSSDYNSLYQRYKLNSSKGVLLYGPPGTGKTLLAHQASVNFGVNRIDVAAAELTSRFVGETELKIAELFAKARAMQPCVLAIDEIDAICPKRDDSQSELEKRTVATFLTLMDGISQDTERGQVLVIATTNRLEVIDPALRRPGRFDVEIEVGIPNAKDRVDILTKLLSGTDHSLNIEEISSISDRAHGYVGADLDMLVKEAGLLSIKRIVSKNEFQPNLDELQINYKDLEFALNLVKPSAMREVQLDIPKVYWKDIGGHALIRQKLQESVEWPLKRPELFHKLNISPPRGILLYGPPGCSKTLMAKALATESKLNFLLVKGPELFSKYVGDSEKRVKEVFRKATMAQPSILFLDEVDALTAKRSDGDGSSSVAERVLAQFLVEMDGIASRGNVTVIGATNRPDIMDSALLRPGRMDRILYVGPPDYQARIDIFKIKGHSMPFDTDVDFEWLAEMTEGCSGAEIVGLCQSAAMIALELDLEKINLDAFKTVIDKGIKKSITSDVLEFYDKFGRGSNVKKI